jgi:hypothetical protein
MKSKILLYLVPLLLVQSYSIRASQTPSPESYSWAIIGAGVAGITSLAVLIDAGVDPATIAWIDPEFNIGRMGKYYRNIPGNVQTSRLLLYLKECPYFKDIPSAFKEALYSYKLEEYQPLHVIVDPLIDFTQYLRNRVNPIQDTITSLEYDGDHWSLQASNGTLNAQKVILAVGAYPKKLNYDIPEIPLDEALDRNILATYVSPEDCIAIFGGMHSAILLLKYLAEGNLAKRVINFYIDPYFYGAPGLEGATGAWAQEVLEKNPPSNITRVLSTPENLQNLLPLCNKVIYAIGYQQNPIIVNGSTKLLFDEHTGVIDHNLYGIGIAFPPTGIINGQKIAKNGLVTYITYAKKLVPQWVAHEGFKEHPSVGINIDQELPWI